MNWVILCWVVIAVTIVWFFLIGRWIDRNPEYAKQVRNHEAPYPWFFGAWEGLFIISCVSVCYLFLHYMFTAFGVDI